MPAIVGLPYTVINEPTDAAVQAGIKEWLANRSGHFPRTKLMFNFIGTVNLKTPLLPADTGQIQGPRWEGVCKRGTVLRWDSATVPVLTSYGQLRNFKFSEMSFRGGVKDALGFYFRADNKKTNQDGEFYNIEHLGSWKYAYGLDGVDPTANLNSEIVWNKPALGNDASFSGAWLWSGMTPGIKQQNQFLNYTIRDSKLEGSHGDYLRFDYGGSIQVEGFNSWIHTGQSNGGVPQGRMLYFPKGGNGDSVMFISLNGLRPELRGPKSVLIDSAWSGAGAIVFNNLRSAANAFKFATATEQYTFRGDARVAFRDSHLQGFVALRGNIKPRMQFDLTDVAGKQQVEHNLVSVGTDPVANGIVRTFDGASAANVKFS
jgi:hypothetical protein